jgi:DNA-binding beta-propeller fold protein YncE
VKTMVRIVPKCFRAGALPAAALLMLTSCNLLSSNPTSDSGFLQPPPFAFSFTTATAGNAQVLLNWQASADATSYTVMRGTSSGSYPTLLASGLTTTSYADTGLQNGTTYYYMVTATGPGGVTSAITEAQAMPILPSMLLIADTGNNRIVAISDMTGSNWTPLSGVAGDPLSLSAPRGVFMDSIGNLYVADSGNSRVISMQDMAGDGWLPFGSVGTGVGQFQNPASISVDNSGNIYVADTGNSRIVQLFDLLGTTWLDLSAGFISPTSIAFQSDGDLLIADGGLNSIVSIEDMAGDGWTDWTATTAAVPSPPAFWTPTAVFTADDGTIYMADSQASTIYHLSAQGTYLSSIQGNVGGDTFLHPSGICVDPYGVIYVADTGNDRIISMINMAGDNWTELNADATGSDLLSAPRSIYCRYGTP